MARPLDGRTHQDVADTVTPLVGVHVDGLDLGTESSVGLQMAEHNQLADADHAPLPLGDQHPTRLPPDLGQSCQVRGQVEGVLLAFGQ